MKGFVEVTLLSGNKIAYKLKDVKAFKGKRVMLKKAIWIDVRESYEQIKQLIKEATEP